MTTHPATAWSDRAIAWKDDAPAIEGPLETVVAAIARLPSISFLSFSITLPDRAVAPFAYEPGCTRQLVAQFRDRVGFEKKLSFLTAGE